MADSCDSDHDAGHRLFAERGVPVHLGAGERLLRSGDANRRLFQVRSGALRAALPGEQDGIPLRAGDLVGVHSFFSGAPASLDVVAIEPSELLAIDRDDAPACGEDCLEATLMPLVIAELLRRQQALREAATQERAAQERLRELDRYTQLGALAAAVAHELNNALAVLTRGSEWLQAPIEALVERLPEAERAAFAAGLAAGRSLPSAVVRERANALRRRHRRLDSDTARQLAHLRLPQAIEERLAAAPEGLSEVAERWELGATMHDLAIAARHAEHVVRSMKELGRPEAVRDPAVDVGETIAAALSILRNAIAGIEVEVDAGPLPTLRAVHGELVQIWVNLVRNACDALRGRPSPRIRIAARRDGDLLRVTVTDNGTGIPPDLLPLIFEPHVTTKKTGLSFGLGLGLTIVRRLVTGHGGRVEAANAAGGGAVFIVELPLGGPA